MISLSILTALTLIPTAILDAPKVKDDPRKVMASYAACLVQKKRARINALIDLPVGRAGERQAWLAINDPDCLPVAGLAESALVLKFEKTSPRDYVFPALYRTDFGRTTVLDFADVDRIGYAVDPAPADAEAQERARRYSFLMKMGDCVVRQSPAEAKALVLAPVESEAETAALGSIRMTLAECVVEGQQLKLNKSLVREMIAEPLYRLTAAKRKKLNA